MAGAEGKGPGLYAATTEWLKARSAQLRRWLMERRTQLRQWGIARYVDLRVFARWVAALASVQEPQPLDADERRAIKRVVLAVLFLTAIFFSLVWIFWTNSALQFWLSAVTGNWSPDKGGEVGGFWFSVSVLLAIMINWLPLLGMILFFIRFVKPVFKNLENHKERLMSEVMTLSKAFSVQNATQKLAVMSVLPESDPELRAKVSKAFDSSKDRWRNRLVDMIGPEAAERIFVEMDKELSPV